MWATSASHARPTRSVRPSSSGCSQARAEQLPSDPPPQYVSVRPRQHLPTPIPLFFTLGVQFTPTHFFSFLVWETTISDGIHYIHHGPIYRVSNNISFRLRRVICDPGGSNRPWALDELVPTEVWWNHGFGTGIRHVKYVSRSVNKASGGYRHLKMRNESTECFMPFSRHHNEGLTPVRHKSCVGRAHRTPPIVLQIAVKLIFKLSPRNTFAFGPVSEGVPGLDREFRNDAVKDQPSRYPCRTWRTMSSTAKDRKSVV